MYKVLIVDDDVNIRRELNKILYGGTSGFQVAGEAGNGRDALKKVISLNPDIVLLDIEMPVMDGLQTLTSIKEKELNCKVIVLSFHDDFDNVKTAMSIGATEYLLKQKLDPKEILRVLTKAAEEIENEIGEKNEICSLKNLANISMKAIRMNLVNDLVKGSISDVRIVQRQMDMIKSDLPLESMVVCCLQVDDFQRASEVYPMWNKELLAFSVDNILDEITQKSGISLYGRADEKNHFIVCCFSKQTSYLKINHLLFEMLTEIVQNLNKFLNVQVTIGVSTVFNDIQKTSFFCKQAICAANYKFFKGKGRIIHHSEVEKYNNFISNEDRKMYLQKISSCIVQNNLDAEKILDSIYNELETANVGLDVIKDFNIEIISAITRQLRELNIEDEVFGTNIFPYEYIYNLETREDLVTWLGSALNCVREILNVRVAPKNYRIEIKKAIEYIETNYIKEINVEDVANHININKVYFSQIFKRETGENFTDFLTRIRMEKAKQLITATDNKIYDVAMEVGIGNYRYFTKLFKDTTGLTPMEYRKIKCTR